MITVAGVSIFSLLGPQPAIVYKSGMRIDADGAPTCYAPPGSDIASLKDLDTDTLANAYNPKTGRWVGIVTDEWGKPILNAIGGYVSPTALHDIAFPVTDQRRYVDATSVPYAAITEPLERLGAQLGDVGIACRDVDGGRLCVAFICADVGPAKKSPGEGSPALAQLLQVDADARKGGVDRGITWIIFPRSSQGWPRAYPAIQGQAQALLDAAGGVDSLIARCSLAA